MSAKRNRLLRELFAKELSAVAPQFRLSAVKSKYVPPGETVFTCELSDLLWLVVILIPDRKGEERFTLEIGWSKCGRVPQLSIRPSLDDPSQGDEVFDEAEYVCRLGKLSGGKDRWWVLPAIDPLKMEHVVRSAAAELQEVGLPYLQRFVRAQGLDGLRER